LDIAKIEAGKVEWKMADVALEDVMDQAIAATSALFQPKGLRMIRQVDPGLPIIQADYDRLVQVVINLISNAVKFTEKGSITCRLTQKDNDLILQVVDTGIGIAPEDQPKVFERFKQLGNTLTDKPQGTGLGLPICQQIVEHHGGKIWVESQPNQGSTFSISLPINTTQPGDNPSGELRFQPRQIDLAPLIQQVEETVPLTPETTLKTILIVDDEDHIRELLQQQLEVKSYRVIQAQDGLDAVQKAKASKPDLIIMDVMMPQMNGFDAAAVIRNNPQTQAIPIIILSIVEDQERGYKVGVDRYLNKPIDVDSLLTNIDTLLVQKNSHKVAMVMDQQASVIGLLTEMLTTQGYQVVETLNQQQLQGGLGPISLGLESLGLESLGLRITESSLADTLEIEQTLQFQKDGEQVLFILLSGTPSTDSPLDSSGQKSNHN
jgi:CheY-like chemotaxis protein